MSITIRPLGTIKGILGPHGITLDLKDASLKDVINHLCLKKGNRIKEELLDKEGELDYNSFLVVANGRRLCLLSEKVQDDDEIVIVNIVGGG